MLLPTLCVMDPRLARLSVHRPSLPTNQPTHTNTNEQDAFAGLEDPTHKSVGSMGYLADSGRAYYVTLLGK